MDIIKNTIRDLKDLGVNGTLSNVIVTKNPGPWTLSYVRYDDGTIGCGCANNERNVPHNPEFIKKFIGGDAYDVASELYDMRNEVFMNSLRISIVCALSYKLISNNGFLRDNGYTVEISDDRYISPDMFQFVKNTDVVAIVGFASWWVPYLSEKVKELDITDLTDPKEFRVIDFDPEEPNVKIFHAEKNKEVLSRADVVYITGETISNGTINELLEYSKNARARIMFGPTSSFYPKALFDRGVNASYMMLFPNTPQFKQQFVLSRGYWYQTKNIKNLLIKKEV